MLLARLITALLLLAQPLPALGLETLLPCPQGCGHCTDAVNAEASDCGCAAGAEDQPQPDCACVHELPPAQPCAPAAAPGLAGGAAADCAAPAPAPVPRQWTWMIGGLGGCAPGLGHDPPPRLTVLCVWRN